MASKLPAWGTKGCGALRESVSPLLPLRESRADRVFEAGFLIAYAAVLFILYTTPPIIYRLAGSVFHNLNLLSKFLRSPFW